MNVKTLVLAASLSLVPVATFAQTTATPTPTPTPTAKKPTINQRKENQQDRIAHGVKTGELNPSQTSRLEHQESGINQEARGMRAQDNGKLTKQDRSTLTRQQNQESRRIARDEKKK